MMSIRKRVLRGLVIVLTVFALFIVMIVAFYGPALNQAAAAITFQSPVISYRYPGTYEGSAKCLHVVARVRVTITSTGVSKVELLERPFGDMDVLVDRIVKAGGVPVDVVTGATASSKVVMKAVDDALIKQKP
jgi:uncharacterized protein with FMN-binding domain